MYYIFNSEGSLIGTSNNEPDQTDLSSRGEYYSKNESDNSLIFNRVVGGKYGGIYETVETQEEILAEQSNLILKERSKILNNTDWVTTRHFEEKMAGKQTTFSEEQISEFIEYRQSLRDITSIENFPFVNLPQPPQFLE